MDDFTVNFIAKLPQGGFSMVIVEEGPWGEGETEANLRRIQARLYDCIAAALDGQLADRFPESKCKPVEIRLDAYDVPEKELLAFFALFTESVPRLPDYAESLATKKFVESLSFVLSIDHLERSGSCRPLRASCGILNAPNPRLA